MAQRNKLNFKKDRRVFRKTANRVNAKNFPNPAMRGGNLH